MKKWAALLFICCLANNFSQTNISPQFSELKGMEDQFGNTHLFYRIYTNYENPPLYQWSNHIYHWDFSSGADTLFLSDSGIESPAYNSNHWISDVDYWNNNPAEFIHSGGGTSGPFFEGSAYIKRFDGYINHFGWFWGSANYIDISQSDDSLLYAGIITDGGPGILRSIDGGRNWDSLSTLYQFLSLNPHHENIYFVENEDRELLRTTDSGNTFNLVDPEFLPDTRLFYDPNQQHVYRKANNKLIVSDNLGEQFSWETVFTKSTTDPFYFSNDISFTGLIFISEGKNIFYSSDFGDNFSLYKSLDRKIIGIYKKPSAGGGSNKLYAATKYKIYEITPDTIQVIKSLPIPEEVLDYYPMAIGNKWVYDYIIVPDDPFQQGDSGIIIREVLEDTTMENGKQYYNILDETLEYGGNIVFERLDTLSGKVYRYFEDTSLVDNEYLIHDLVAEVGDTIYASRYFFYEEILTEVLPNSIFGKWGLLEPKKVYQEYTLGWFSYSLTQEIGLDSIHFIFDFGFGRTELKGCIIDGVIYGDTTTVGVEDEENPIATSFKLEQNYPNPFNPITKIKFIIPNVETHRDASLQAVTLKVYDILGNEIATLINEELSAGEYEVEFNIHSVEGRNLTSGVYFYQLKVGGPETSSGQHFIQTKKMVYLK